MDGKNYARLLSHFGVSLISDGLDTLARTEQVLSAPVRPLVGAHEKTVVGVARTLAYRVLAPQDRFGPVDSRRRLAFIRMLEEHVGDGDVLAVSFENDVPEYAVIGGLFAMMYKNLGAAAIVADGFVRDQSDLSKLGLTVVARGYSPTNGFGRIGLHSVGEPVDLGGVRVADGDYLAIDRDGAVAVPNEAPLLEDLTKWLATAVKREDETRATLTRGEKFSDAFERFGQV